MTLTERIIELVPEIEKGYWSGGNFADSPEPYWTGNPRITLADVLRAMDINSLAPEVRLYVSSNMLRMETDRSAEIWNLSADLDGQSEETKAFISKILGV